MSFSPVLRWFALAIVLLLSLGWKVAVSHDAYNKGLEKKEADGQRKIAEFLFANTLQLCLRKRQQTCP